MLVGALVDAGADPEAIAAAIGSLDAGAVVSFEKVKRNGLGATQYHVAVEETRVHRHLSHIVKMIEKAELPPRAQTKRDCHVPAAGRSGGGSPPGAHRKSPLSRSGGLGFDRRYRGRVPGLRSARRRHGRVLAAERGQRHGGIRARLVAGSGAGNGAAAGGRADLRARPRGGTDHAHRRGGRGDARQALRRAAGDEGCADGLRRRQPRFSAPGERAASDSR